MKSELVTHEMDGGSVVSWARLPSESLACETSGSVIRALAAREGWWFSGQSAGSSRRDSGLMVRALAAHERDGGSMVRALAAHERDGGSVVRVLAA